MPANSGLRGGSEPHTELRPSPRNQEADRVSRSLESNQRECERERIREDEKALSTPPCPSPARGA